ncbi:MAG: ABC transporter ATP-binding protein/permease [Candidatus Thermoplasmatota archaeon]|nr:ABC transporter ATP-binding protein/permease [Candidatus Thermoplasmatota archaeon]
MAVDTIRKKLVRVSDVFQPLLFSRPYLHGKSKYLAVVLAAGFLSTFARLLIPIYIGDAVSSIELRNISGVIGFAFLIIYVSIISGVLNFVVGYGSQYLSQKYAYNLRNNVVNHLVRKKFHYFETKTSGDLLSRCTMDIQATRNFILATLSQLLPTLFMIGIALYLLITLNIYYAMIFLVTVPVLIYLGMVFQKKQRTHWRSIRNYYGSMSEKLQENIVGQRVVRGFSAQNQEEEKFTDTTNDYYGEYMDVAYLRGTYNNLMPLTVSAAASAILIFGGYTDVITGISVGGLVAAINIFSLITAPVSSLGRLIVFSENARAGIGRINEVIGPDDEEYIEKSGGKFPKGSLGFNSVNFSRAGRKILRNINLQINQGEFFGLTGSTGAGKTSMVNLITRYYDPDSGDITIGGVNIKNIPLSLLRTSVRVVPQEISLLSGTIRDNIAFGDREAPIETIKKAASIAMISDFIEGLPDGYETLVGERGITLSGGQRQRVAIARAVVTVPEILILDDATSSVDPETELEIFKNIKREFPEIITVIVTHRESALKFSDKMGKIDHGTLEEVSDMNEVLNIVGSISPETTGGT